MYLREPQFHLKNSKLAEVFNTIFNDLIVGRQDVETLETELYSYDIYVKNTILTVFIFRAEIVSLLGEKDVEVLGFCYPRALEQKIIDVSVNKNYQTVFKVPNGIKDLETVEVRNLRLQSPGFSELYSRFFINPHYYILNAYPVHCDPKLTFVEPAPLTPEQEVEAAAYDRFCLHDLPKFEKAKTSLIKEMGVAFSRIPEMYGRFRLKRKDPPTDLFATCGAKPSLKAEDYEERKVDHDLYFTFLGEKIEEVTPNPFTGYYDVLKPAFIAIPHYMEETGTRVVTPVPFDKVGVSPKSMQTYVEKESDEEDLLLIEEEDKDSLLFVDIDLFEVMDRIQTAFDHVNQMITTFIKKWGYHPELVSKTFETINMFSYVASQKQDLLYSFNSTEILEAHLNKVLGRIDEMKAEQGVPDAEWGLDCDSWVLWDYTNPDNPVKVPEWHLGEELVDHYSERYVEYFSGYSKSTPHKSLRPYVTTTVVPEEKIAEHAIGSVRHTFN